MSLADRAPAALARANWQASPMMAAAWWGLVLIRGALPAVLALALGSLVGSVQDGASITVPLAITTTSFAILSVSGPIHTQISAILGDRTSGHLQAVLTDAVSTPHGIAHLERPGLADELVAARDFDLGIIGPPISVSMGFVAAGLVAVLSGAAQAVALATVTWWGAIVIAAAWLSSHWLLRESSFWARRGDPEVQAEQRHADYAYRLAVDAPPAKEVRVFGLAEWVVDRFAVRRSRLLDMQWQAMKLRQRSLTTVLAVLIGAYVVVIWPLFSAAIDGTLSAADLVVAAQALVGAAALGVGGFTWALDAAASPVLAVEKLAERMAIEGALEETTDTRRVDGLPATEIRFRDVGFRYPSGGEPVYEHLDLTINAGESLAIVGRNGVGKTTLVKLLCRLYDPTSGAIEVDGIDVRTLDVQTWRERVSVVFQDFVRFELSLRDNLLPSGAGASAAPADDALLTAALQTADADALAGLDQPLSKAYDDGTDLSGGQWQRVALARALAAVQLGAGVVVLDEPTAQLDVRGEAEIFGRLLEATRGCTTILISHRFSTVRQADRIVVIDAGRVVEDGSHDQLMALGGLYRTMFDLQAARFAEGLPADPDDDPAIEVEA
ncbi:MAG: ABC transporter ATP-binding protein [Actinomycetota bacterium]